MALYCKSVLRAAGIAGGFEKTAAPKNSAALASDLALPLFALPTRSTLIFCRFFGNGVQQPRLRLVDSVAFCFRERAGSGPCSIILETPTRSLYGLSRKSICPESTAALLNGLSGMAMV